jgi:2-polyprenyl-3-methyl-5-hydroxy-6-metoxy-1,4-benzoquinol methylase
MMEEERESVCPLCKDRRNSIFDVRQFQGYEIKNRLCQNCGLVFQFPHLSQSELDEFYKREYRLVAQGDEGPTAKDLATQRGRAASLLGFSKKHISSVYRHLDIGSSAGILLQAFQETFAVQAVGVEPGEAYRAFSQRLNLRVFPSLEHLKAANEAQFDLVSVAHVLEHMIDPVDFLQDLRQNHLSPDGWLLVEVPNLYAHDSFEVAHMIAFSSHTLVQVLHKAGFEVVSLQKHGRPRSQLIPLYLTVLGRPGSGEEMSFRPEHCVREKRRVGMFYRRIITRLFPSMAWRKV